MIKQFSKRTTLLCPATAPKQYLAYIPIEWQEEDIRLHPIHSIKSLIQKQPNRPTKIYPRRTIPIQGRSIIKHRQEIDNHETEAGQRNLLVSAL